MEAEMAVVDPLAVVAVVAEVVEAEVVAEAVEAEVVVEVVAETTDATIRGIRIMNLKESKSIKEHIKVQCSLFCF
jgi:hypothetical protein